AYYLLQPDFLRLALNENSQGRAPSGMNPRLVSISGPLQGKTFPLADEACSIGRESANQLCVSDASVSRRHCVINKEDGRFRLSDLESLNGSFVNGVPIKERYLEHGDQIKLGDTLFLFLLHEGEAQAAASPVLVSDEMFISTHSTIRMKSQDSLLLQPDKLLESLPANARLARHLNALLKISTAINSVRGLEALQQHLLELVFEVVPAERGAILLVGDSAEEFATIFGVDKAAGENRPVQVSRTIIFKVMEEKSAIMSNDVTTSPGLSTSESIIASRIRSILCVPLISFEKLLGVIYLDGSDVAARFDKDHLELMTAVAGIAAVALDNAHHVEWLESENRRLQNAMEADHSMIGESKRMKQVYQFLAKVAPTDSTVMIRGESGTGKELAARAIHLHSLRATKPFVAINCAALTETLLESELFGHEKGAFTGALAQKKGKLEVADTGTIFLDEIGELATQMQAKLLRVLQEREFDRVGGTRPVKVDVRVIAATNKELEDAIKAGDFRQDLYYRLNVVSIVMPPLRERREDIPLLASYFAAKFSKKSKRQVMGISQSARAYLTNYDWPGNVRELENAIERAVVLGSSNQILPEDLPEAVLETAMSLKGAAPAQYHDAVREVKKQLILKAMEQSDGSFTEAAKILGVHPNYLHRLIRNMDLKEELKK
ncbi:MAG TPA: sigma 54-interacting transcriptional regulator, partial [Pyrinomonadaceae bacterium]|nr:sigma 54-interacting transcriptional regulator [Pyrinomonadaceae bacterium]